MHYEEDGSGGIELFDMKNDPLQFTNLAQDSRHAATVARFQKMMAERLREVRDNDL